MENSTVRAQQDGQSESSTKEYAQYVKRSFAKSKVKW
jgi:hypothetical protein